MHLRRQNICLAVWTDALGCWVRRGCRYGHIASASAGLYGRRPSPTVVTVDGQSVEQFYWSCRDHLKPSQVERQAAARYCRGSFRRKLSARLETAYTRVSRSVTQLHSGAAAGFPRNTSSRAIDAQSASFLGRCICVRPTTLRQELKRDKWHRSYLAVGRITRMFARCGISACVIAASSVSGRAVPLRRSVPRPVPWLPSTPAVCARAPRLPRLSKTGPAVRAGRTSQ